MVKVKPTEEETAVALRSLGFVKNGEHYSHPHPLFTCIRCRVLSEPALEPSSSSTPSTVTVCTFTPAICGSIGDPVHNTILKGRTCVHCKSTKSRCSVADRSQQYAFQSDGTPKLVKVKGTVTGDKDSNKDKEASVAVGSPDADANFNQPQASGSAITFDLDTVPESPEVDPSNTTPTRALSVPTEIRGHSVWRNHRLAPPPFAPIAAMSDPEKKLVSDITSLVNSYATTTKAGMEERLETVMAERDDLRARLETAEKALATSERKRKLQQTEFDHKSAVFKDEIEGLKSAKSSLEARHERLRETMLQQGNDSGSDSTTGQGGDDDDDEDDD